MYERLEALQLRLRTLESLDRCPPLEKDQDIPICGSKIEDDLARLELRFKSFENKLGILYEFSDIALDGKRHCPANNCGRGYTQVRRLHEHIRKAPGSGHALLEAFIDQTYCYECDKYFQDAQSLYAHEKAQHNAQYQTRLERFIPLFSGRWGIVDEMEEDGNLAGIDGDRHSSQQSRSVSTEASSRLMTGAAVEASSSLFPIGNRPIERNAMVC